MAYLRELCIMCPACNHKKVAFELFNRFNDPIGKYCSACAKKKLKDLQVREVKNRSIV